MANDSTPTGLQPFLLVVFGGTGDLTRRKLVPALCRLLQDDAIRCGAVELVAVGRRPLSDEGFRDGLTESLQRGGDRREIDRFQEFRDSFSYHRLDFLNDPEGFGGLEQVLLEKSELLAEKAGAPVGRLYYLAVAPDAFVPVVRGLHGQGMLEEKQGYRRVVAEKPFGSDLASARTLQEDLTAMVPEDRLYRIDHYLGKEMVRSLLGLRFSNRVFEPIWNGAHIDHVQISACETEGVGTRGGYYEAAGAMKDMLQSHLLQMLALVAMDPPVSLAPDAIRDAKVRVLRSVVPMSAGEGQGLIVRGQYTAGETDGQAVPGYREEPRVESDSDTDTFAAMRVRVANYRWEGVPFYLRAGKRMHRKGTWITITFKDPPTKPLYPELDSSRPDRLVVNVQPMEGFYFEVNTLSQARGYETTRVRMDYCHSCKYGATSPQAYERLLADAAEGNPSLFVRWDELETAWSLVDDIVGRGDEGHPDPYAAGTSGPESAIRLIEADGRTWWEPTE